MDKVNFNLSKKGEDKPAVIMVEFTYRSGLGKGKQIRFSSKLSTLPKYFSKESKRLRPGAPSRLETNHQLIQIEEKVLEGIRIARKEGREHSKELVRWFKDFVFGVNEETVLVYDVYLEWLGKRRDIGAKRRKHLQTVGNRLRDFDPTFSFASLDSGFKDDFCDYLIQLPGVKKDSTVWRYIKDIKQFLDYTRKKGYHNLPTGKDFTHPYIKADKEYLTQEEQDKLFNHEFKDFAHTLTRDLFIFCCNTALRIGDALSLEWDDIKEDSIEHGGKTHKVMVISKFSEKTKVNLYLLLPDIAIEILNKYKGMGWQQCFAGYERKYYQYRIKDVCRIAGIDSTVIKLDGVNQEVNQVKVPKYEKITFHSARHTFVTTRIQRGWSRENIRQYTRHKSMAEIETYFHDDKETQAKIQFKAINNEKNT